MPEIAIPRDDPIPMLSDADSLPVADRRADRDADWLAEEGKQSFQVKLGRSTVRIGITHLQVPGWLMGVVADLNRVAELPANWDSYGALPIDQRTLEHALYVIVSLMDADSPRPQIGATVRGGVEFEWHSDDKDLEIQVERPFQVHGYFCHDLADEEWEDNIGIDLDRLRPYLRRLPG